MIHIYTYDTYIYIYIYIYKIIRSVLISSGTACRPGWLACTAECIRMQHTYADVC